MKEAKVLLVYPASQLMAIETPRPDGSLGLLYLAGALEEAGIETDILDVSVGAAKDNLRDVFYKGVLQSNNLIRIGISCGRIREVVEAGGYNVVGISSNFSCQTRMALEAANVVRKLNPEILVIAGGVNARNLPGYFLKNGLVDIICGTEGEKIITRIIENWSRGLPFDNLDGVIYGENTHYKSVPPRPESLFFDLDQLPFPRWNKLPLDKYERIASPHGAIGGENQRYAPMMTSRGCPFRCDFCHISLEKLAIDMSGPIGNPRFKSIDRVVEEAKILKSLGIKKIYLEDDSFLARKRRVKKIFERLSGMGFKIADVNGVNLLHFAVRGQGDKLEVDRDYLAFLKSCGFDQIVFPVESASQRILDRYASGKLNHSKFNVVELVKTASELGIICPINIMIGFPDETEEEILQSIELGKKLVDAGAIYCTFFIPIPFPGSKLFSLAVREGYLDSGFDPDLMNWKNTVMKNTTVPPQRIVELRDWAWKNVNSKEHIRRRQEESAGNLYIKTRP